MYEAKENERIFDREMAMIVTNLISFSFSLLPSIQFNFLLVDHTLCRGCLKISLIIELKDVP